MKLFAVGDIHGRYDEFTKLLRYSGFNAKEDYLVSTGDLVDRGPKSYEVVKWFKEMNFATDGRVQAVFGNHEHLFISYNSGHVKEKNYFSKFIGGDKTITSYNNSCKSEEDLIEHLSFLGSLPPAIELGDFIFTHAGYDESKECSEQNITTTAWDDYGRSEPIWKRKFKCEKTVIFGHTPTIYIYQGLGLDKNFEVWRNEENSLIGIDCSFSKARKMCILDVLNNIEYYYCFSQKKCYKKEGVF